MVTKRCVEYLEFNDKLYQIYRKIPKDQIKPEHVLDVRDAWFCDTVLKTKNNQVETFLFLIEVKDAEIIEEYKDEEFPTPTPASIP